MAAGVWKGFTEKELESCQIKEGEKIAKSIPATRKAVNLQGLKDKRQARDKVLGKYHGNQSPRTSFESEIPESAKLLKGPEEPSPSIDKDEKKENGLEVPEGTSTTTTTTVMGSNSVCLKVVEGKAYELVDRNSAEVTKATLEIFESRQKMLEEENRKKKEMLAKVLNARKKQTTEEAKRLQRIQEELQKLDVLLSNDVGILRNKIEEASLDFAEAQKRYNKAEKEFLEARKNLLGKSEKKELLTKLLCTIIEQNELRKAQKLSDLMEKLEINENGKIVTPEAPGAS